MTTTRAAHAGTVSRQLAKARHFRADRTEGTEGFYVHTSLTKASTTVGYTVHNPRTPLGAAERDHHMNALRTTLEGLGYTIEEHRAKKGAPLHWLVLTTKPLGPSAAHKRSPAPEAPEALEAPEAPEQPTTTEDTVTRNLENLLGKEHHSAAYGWDVINHGGTVFITLNYATTKRDLEAWAALSEHLGTRYTLEYNPYPEDHSTLPDEYSRCSIVLVLPATTPATPPLLLSDYDDAPTYFGHGLDDDDAPAQEPTMPTTISRPQFEALRTAAPVAQWQDIPSTHALACLKDRHAVTAHHSTEKVLIRLGLAEVAQGAVAEETGCPWSEIVALTPAGERLAASLEPGGPLPTLAHIADLVAATPATVEEQADAIALDAVQYERRTGGDGTADFHSTTAYAVWVRKEITAALHQGRTVTATPDLIKIEGAGEPTVRFLPLADNADTPAPAPVSVWVTTEGGERIEYAHIPNGDPARVEHFLDAARAVPTFSNISTTPLEHPMAPAPDLAAARLLLGLVVTTPARPGSYHAMDATTADDGTVTLTLMDTDGGYFTAPAQGAAVTATDRVHYEARIKTHATA